MKRMLRKALTLLVLVTGTNLLTSTANAADNTAAFEKTPEITLSDLGRLRGKKLTLLYVVGAKGLITTEDLQIQVSDVKSALGASSIENVTQVFSPVAIKREGFRPTFNYLLIIVHNQDEFFWKNADGGVPTDPRVADVRTLQAKSFEFAEIVSISRIELKKMEQDQRTPGKVEISLK
jgi:hypothetical protein